MKPFYSFYFLVCCTFCTFLSAKEAPLPINLEPFFYEMDACFLLYDLSEDQYVYQFHPDISKQRFSPCSTFKIPNTLIALEEKILESPKSVIPWNRQAQPHPIFERDHNLQTAFKHSVVWFYQKIAQSVGMDKYRSYLTSMQYGNQDPSSDLTTFWLASGSLLISPQEQILFLNKLCKRQLPFSTKTFDTAQDLFAIETPEKALLSGKTGSNGRGLGWFVGYLTAADNKKYTFATLINSEGHTNGLVAKEISKSIFRELKLL